MIERKIVAQKLKEYEVNEYIQSQIGARAAHSATKIQRTPLGEKITIFSSRPSAVKSHQTEPSSFL